MHNLRLDVGSQTARLELMTTKNIRPKFLNLFRIHLPVTGMVSILHRVSGALLVLSLPLVVLLFSRSLQNERGFDQVLTVLQTWPMRWLMLLIVLSLLFHLFSGIRFLLLDLDIGMRLRTARGSAWGVIALGVLTLIALLIEVLR